MSAPPYENAEGRPSRREMLKAAAVAAVGLATPLVRGEDSPASTPAAPAVVAPVSPPPWWLASEFRRSRVVELRSDRVLNGVIPDGGIVRRMLRQGLAELTAIESPDQAMAALIGDRRRITIKFNSVGAAAIGTTERVARSIVEVLEEAGVSADRLRLVEAPPAVLSELGLPAGARGWGSGIPVGDTAESLAAWVHESDAIINVPFLKTHHFAGMSGALKNISHAVIRRPARYHANGCSPFVGEIWGSPTVSDRIRLNVMNALRIVVRNGPDARPDDVVGYSALLFSRDPVAMDGVGRLILDRERAGATPGGGLNVRYLDDAARRGLGRVSPPLVEHVAAGLAE